MGFKNYIMKNIILMVGILLSCLNTSLLAQENTFSLFVDGICGMCEERIEKAALQVDGVTAAAWEVDTRMLSITTDNPQFDEEQIHWAVTEAGHDTKKYFAPDQAYENLHACCKYRDLKQVAAHRESGTTLELFVDGICGMCKTRIEAAVGEIVGVEAADWKVDTRQLTVLVDGNGFDEELLHQAVNQVGHDTKKSKASDEAYENLHACCKYRDPEVVADHRPAPVRPEAITGQILVEENDETVPLPGINVYWADQEKVAVTDVDGRFELERPAGADQLIASYVGYYADTLTLTNETWIKLTLTAGATLETVEVTYERKSIEVSFLDPILTQQIDRKELLKAACCNLAESFETNPAVDVSFTDAVTGARQIEMLGLAGPYVQITRENLPDVRGLASIYGLVYLPGPWVEGIQLSKGPGSVVNGYEGMTGQINVELKKPEEGERFYLNLYGNEGGRMEANANARIALGERWSTGLLLHGSRQPRENDRNNDGFLDMPTGNEWTVLNRWKYRNENGWNAQFGIKATHMDKLSGQLAFDEKIEQPTVWGANMDTRRLEGWAKVGRAFPDRPNRSIGLQLSGVVHEQDAFFGATRYDAEQRSFYANFIYQEMLGNPKHLLKTGASLQWDQYDEWLGERFYERDEMVPGAFAEYNFLPSDDFTAVLGLRGDHHNNFGFFLTPRLHLRYAPSDKSVFRLSAGQGRRTASIIAENLGMLATSRRVILESNTGDNPYGLDQEVAWNVGLNLRQTFVLQERELILTLDGYHTRFDQQVVVDYDQSPREVRFYNLDGLSYSNTFQAQLDYALLPELDLRIAYRFNDVRTDYQEGRLERPFVARHRAFVNLAYATAGKWDFDLTVNWQGAKRIPSTVENPADFQLPGRSPDFVVVNGQISKQWWDRFDLYLGVENLFNFVQEAPILAADDPFGTYFDSSLVWGPIFGRMVYAGMRYTLE